MARPTATLSEELAVVGRIKPQTVTAAATAQSDVVDMQMFGKVLVILHLGDYAAGTDGTLVAGIYGDSASNGSFSTLLTGKTITSALFTGVTGDDSVALIDVDAAEVAGQSLRYIRLKVTPANQNLLLAGEILGGLAHYNPAHAFDLAAVKQIVT